MIRRKSTSAISLKGNLWAKGETHEDPLKKREEALGREWFAITAFPLFAGTFGPIATALNICALVQPWRCELDPRTLEFKADIQDPKWLVGINAVSLVFGAAANLSILFVRSDRSVPLARSYLQLVLITIIGGFLASFLLIALVVTASLTLPYHTPPTNSFTEAYYYAIMSAGLYLITSSFIIYTAYMLLRSQRIKESLPRQVSKGHRSLKILTIVFMAYLLIGAAIFSHIESWRYLDALFWADVTILTIGFGDFRPKTHLGRSLLFPYTIFGVFTLVLTVYCITRVVFERGKSMWEIRLRDQERIRRFQQREAERQRNAPPTLAALRAKAAHEAALNSNSTSAETNTTENAIEEIDGDPSALEKSPFTTKQSRDREARRKDFKAMQEILRKSAFRRIYYSLALWSLLATSLWLIGALVFWLSEKDRGWSYFTSIYFTFISLLTIGYGDVTLSTRSGKAFFVLWSLICVPTLTMLITTATEAVGSPFLSGAREWIYTKILRRQPPKLKRRLSRSVVPEENMGHNEHDRNHLLVQAIKRIAKDHVKLSKNRQKPEYSFEDWEYIFFLMGILDTDPDDFGPNTLGSPNGGGGVRMRGRRRTSLEQWKDESGRGRNGVGGMGGRTEGEVLDWLHGMNPLNVSETLTEWMLLTLVEKLEMELGEMRRRLGRTGGDGSGRERQRDVGFEVKGEREVGFAGDREKDGGNGDEMGDGG